MALGRWQDRVGHGVAGVGVEVEDCLSKRKPVIGVIAVAWYVARW